MDSREQSAGEKQVRDVLVRPLLRRGLMRPAGQSKDQFADMIDDICARLAYMSAVGLAALEEQCAANPGGKASDRFPIGTEVLKWAAVIEPPSDSASPLIRAVFAAAVGVEAIEQGHAPELLVWLRKHRRWPSAFVISQVRSVAAGPVRDLARIEEALARGEEITEAQASFRARRRMQVEKCREIAALARAGGLA